MIYLNNHSTIGDCSMKSLKEQIAELNEEKARQIPKDILETMRTVTAGQKAMNMEENSLKTGDQAPDFTLPDHTGVHRSLLSYLHEQPIVLSFYRGGW